MNRAPRTILATAAALAIGTAALAYAQEQRREVSSIPPVVTGAVSASAPATPSPAPLPPAEKPATPTAEPETSATAKDGSPAPGTTQRPAAAPGATARPAGTDHEVVTPSVRDEDDVESADEPDGTETPDTTPEGN